MRMQSQYCIITYWLGLVILSEADKLPHHFAKSYKKQLYCFHFLDMQVHAYHGMHNCTKLGESSSPVQSMQYSPVQ